MEILVIAAVLAVIPAAIAQSKGRSFGLWWLYGLLLWIVALIHSLVMSPNQQAIESKRLQQGEKKCPQCAELVKAEARICRFCQFDFYG